MKRRTVFGLLGVIVLAGCQTGINGVPKFSYKRGYAIAGDKFIVVEAGQVREFYLTLVYEGVVYGFFAEQYDRSVAILSEDPPRNSAEAMELFRSAKPPRLVTARIEQMDDLSTIVSDMLEAGEDADNDSIWWLISNDPVVLAQGHTTQADSAAIKRPRSNAEILTNVTHRVSLVTQSDLNLPVYKLFILDRYPENPGFPQGSALSMWNDNIRNTTRIIRLPNRIVLGELLQKSSLWSSKR